MDTIVNRVAQSSLITLDLSEYYHHGERIVYDIAQHLYEGLILREKEFRRFLSEHDWETYRGKNVAITCSTDAIIPIWAYMLLATKLQPYAHKVIFGTLAELENALFQDALSKIDLTKFQDAKVVIKGCGKVPVPPFAYVEITRLLLPYAHSIMYGEPCSTVPIFKRTTEKNST
ncbi:MAG: DUF2480 family protein [Cytophagales bacterium]|nr:DUF2480 family protein [Cytophagales bacterium]MDW8385327.1 DUF2480 family protein [Flammeovirgaceae bacterium]